LGGYKSQPTAGDRTKQEKVKRRTDFQVNL
jgi:hypothetical protein